MYLTKRSALAPALALALAKRGNRGERTCSCGFQELVRLRSEGGSKTARLCSSSSFGCKAGQSPEAIAARTLGGNGLRRGRSAAAAGWAVLSLLSSIYTLIKGEINAWYTIRSVNWIRRFLIPVLFRLVFLFLRQLGSLPRD